MKKVVLSLIFLVSITILVTGCSKKEEEPAYQERNVTAKGVKTLICNIVEDEDGVIEEMNVNISRDYDKNELVNGSFIVKLTLNDNATEEEVGMLRNISMCSNSVMGEVINYGICDTTFEDKSSISTLVIDKEKISSNTNLSLEEIKDFLEKNREDKSICTIKQADE